MPSRQPPSPNRSPRPRPGSGRDRHGAAWLWLYGVHAVLAAVANPGRRIRRLLASQSGEARLSRAAAVAAPVSRPTVEVAERGAIEALLAPHAVHQGMAALVAPLPEVALETVLEGVADGGRACVVVLDQATDPRNVGAVIRSAAAFAAVAVITQDRHAPAATGALAKAAAGGLETVPFVAVVNLARSLRTLKAAGFWCVGLDGEAREGLAGSLPAGRVALVFGSEGHGLRRLVRETCDGLARIPIVPESGSLNLSAAAAIALYELARGSEPATTGSTPSGPTR